MPEACQRLPRRSEIHYVAIRRLRQKDTGHNWKVADIVPRPSLLMSGEVVTTSIQTAAFEWCKWGRRSAQSTWESRPQLTDPRRGITVAGVFLAGSAGEQSERSAAWRGVVSILNGQN